MERRGFWMEAHIEVYVRDRQYQANLFRWSNIYHRYCNKRVIEQIIWNIILCFMSCVSIFCSKNERFLVWFKYSNKCTTIQVMNNVLYVCMKICKPNNYILYKSFFFIEVVKFSIWTLVNCMYSKEKHRSSISCHRDRYLVRCCSCYT